jgi:hypothetical protein
MDWQAKRPANKAIFYLLLILIFGSSQEPNQIAQPIANRA